MSSADFEKVLGARPWARSEHFAVHHLAAVPARTAAAMLSTGREDTTEAPVDDSAAAGLWLGTVVPKRHARRAVTRNLLKRQIKSVVAQRAQALPRGLWVVRLRSPFDKAQFVSAASEGLRSAVRSELDALLARRGA